MSKGQRRSIFIFSLIIGGLLLFNSYNETHRVIKDELRQQRLDWLRPVPVLSEYYLTYLVKQPTLYLGIVSIGIGTFILKGGKP